MPQRNGQIFRYRERQLRNIVPHSHCSL